MGTTKNYSTSVKIILFQFSDHSHPTHTHSLSYLRRTSLLSKSQFPEIEIRGTTSARGEYAVSAVLPPLPPATPTQQSPVSADNPYPCLPPQSPSPNLDTEQPNSLFLSKAVSQSQSLPRKQARPSAVLVMVMFSIGYV